MTRSQNLMIRPGQEGKVPLQKLLGVSLDDFLDFADDSEGDGPGKDTSPWSILIVDDDDEVHQAISLALSAVEIGARPLLLVHCCSASEARSLLLTKHVRPDLMLLDVVMETVDAGLPLLQDVRANATTRDLPILLHTGQPGFAPEHVVRNAYAISGYLTKSSMTRDHLVGAIAAILSGSGTTPGLAS